MYFSQYVAHIMPRSLKYLLRALRSRNYRLFFLGQGISLVGTWMQRIALGWLVYRMTGSAFLLGAVSFFGLIPVFVFTPFAGVWVDRFDRHRILVVTQALAMLQALVLSLLVLFDLINVWEIMSLSLFLGLINALDAPARQAFVVEMVRDKEDLSNAIALNSSLFNGARLVGPTVAGLLIVAFGEGVCFLVNGLSYIAVIIALFMMRIDHKAYSPQSNNIFYEFKEGMVYSFRSLPIRSVLILVSITGLFGMSYTVLMPIFARDILQGDAQTLGFLMGAGGIGALGGAFYLAMRKSVVGIVKVITIASIIFALGLILFSFSEVYFVSLPLMLLVGFGMMAQMASCNTLLQSIVDDSKRGRVMSLYATAFMGVAPFGSLLVGSVAGGLGAVNAMLICGGASLVGSLLFILHIRKINTLVNPILMGAES